MPTPPAHRGSSQPGTRTTAPRPRLDAAVARPLADLPLALDRLGGLGQHRRESDHALALGAELEEALLDLGAEVDAGGDLVGDRVRVEVEARRGRPPRRSRPAHRRPGTPRSRPRRRVRLVRDELDLAACGTSARRSGRRAGSARAPSTTTFSRPSSKWSMTSTTAQLTPTSRMPCVVLEHEPELAAVVEALRRSARGTAARRCAAAPARRARARGRAERGRSRPQADRLRFPSAPRPDQARRSTASSPTSPASPSRRSSASSASSAWSSSAPTRATSARSREAVEAIERAACRS